MNLYEQIREESPFVPGTSQRRLGEDEEEHEDDDDLVEDSGQEEGTSAVVQDGDVSRLPSSYGTFQIGSEATCARWLQPNTRDGFS